MDKCQRPGCGGTIVDGICEDCGRPPLGKTLIGGAVAAAAAGATTSLAAAARAAALAEATSGTGLGSSGSAPRGATAATRGTGSFGTTGAGRAGSTGRRRGTTGSSARRNKLGGGLISLPPLPSAEPEQLVMADPKLPENKRYCPSCQAKVQREHGFCTQCGAEYDFRPTLKAGDAVVEYEIKGPIAHGGLGWIYLAYDVQLKRYAVLKGLLNTSDAMAAAAAVAERQFLAAVKHAKIVGVYRFLTRGAEGYIVMEYVGGTTIDRIRKDRGPLPVDEAIAYIADILPAFAYLHQNGMVYCDFKPANMMREGDAVKLIDLGAVRRIDDPAGDIFSTQGYNAPELDQKLNPDKLGSPSPSSDLYTIGRTLAVLILDTKERFRYADKHQYALPARDQEPLFRKYDSLYRFLMRATAKDPEARFQTADEMLDQLQGVFREIVSVDGGAPRGAPSELFMGDALVEADLEAGVEPSEKLLPAVKVDGDDPAKDFVFAAGGLSDPERRRAYIESGMARFPGSAELRYRQAEAAVDAGAHTEAAQLIDAAEKADPFDWRSYWLCGRMLLALGRAAEAVACFERVYDELPGELAPKLALGVALEMAGRPAAAEQFYRIVAGTDPAYVSADFGLARCRLAAKDVKGAAEAYARVPAASSVYAAAQLALARTLIGTGSDLAAEDIFRAQEVVKAVPAKGGAVHRAVGRTFLAALDALAARKLTADPQKELFGRKLLPRELRFGAEAAFRNCARLARTPGERIALVDLANQVRPRTLV
jgi:serine/threonine-protein kinase PknG